MHDAKVVLLIEDELPMRRLLHVTLKHQGYRPIEATTGRAGIEMVRARAPSVVLLDLGLPDIDGIEVTETIRRTSRVPIVVLSARDTVEEKVTALDCGANDYITKPFGWEELLARIRVVLRQSSDVPNDGPGGVFTVGGLRVDFDMRIATSEARPAR
jgi:two-component system KDP operon response regulator KdpE